MANKGLTDISVTKTWRDGRAYFETYVDALKNAIGNVSSITNLNLVQIAKDIAPSYSFTNNGTAFLAKSLQEQINDIQSGGVPITGTTSNDFTIRSASNYLKFNASTLTTPVTLTAPNESGEIVLDTAVQTLTNKTYSAGTFSGDSVFDTDVFKVDSTNDRTYFGSASSYTINSQTYKRQMSMTTGGLFDSKKFIDDTSAEIVDAVFKDSATPAVSDGLYDFQVIGRSSTAVERMYGRQSFTIKSPTNAAEEGRYLLALMRAGVSTNILDLDSTGNTIHGATILDSTLNVAGDATFDTSTLFVDAANNIVAAGAAAHTDVDGQVYKIQSTNTNHCFVGISTSSTASGAINAMWHNSTTPAVNDTAGFLRCYANDNGGGIDIVSSINTVLEDVTAGSEDASVLIRGIQAGTLTDFGKFVNSELELEDVDPPTANRLNMNSGCKGWLDYDDNSGSVTNSYNVSGVSDDDGDGLYIIAWDTNFAGASENSVTGNATSSPYSVSMTGGGVGDTTITIWNINTGVVADSSFDLIAMGNQ